MFRVKIIGGCCFKFKRVMLPVQLKGVNPFKGFPRPCGLTVMGQALGSAPALELVSSKPTSINALIIESGFAHAEPLLTNLGIDP
jgi:hypothetical protein